MPSCGYARSNDACAVPVDSPPTRSLLQNADWSIDGRSRHPDRAHAASHVVQAPAPAPRGLGLLAGAPQAHLVKAAAAHKKKIEAAKERGDLHYTTHGCHCLLEWSFEGQELKGCNKVATDFNEGLPWCAVTHECHKAEGKIGDLWWDFCVLADEVDHHRTVHGCHCSPRFAFEGEIMGNCVKTSLGPRWCYVFEGGNLCEEALRTEHDGQHWDHCFIEEQTSSFLTRSGCHCMPEFYLEDGHFEGCSKIPGRDKPGCLVFEDETLCTTATPEPGTHFLYDDCIFVGEPDDEEAFANSTLVMAGVPNCHCLPNWEYEGVEYDNCNEGAERPWCFIAEDPRVCPDVDGKKGLRPWRYCGSGVIPATTVQPQVNIAYGKPVSGSHACCGGSLRGLVDGDIGGDFAYQTTDKPSVVQINLESVYYDVTVTLFNRAAADRGGDLAGTKVYLSPKTYESISDLEGYLCGDAPEETESDAAYPILCGALKGTYVIAVNADVAGLALREIEVTGKASLDGMWESKDGIARVEGTSWTYWANDADKTGGIGSLLQVMIAGTGGETYIMSSMTDSTFSISGGFGDGAATYTANEIAFIDGQRFVRQTAATTRAPTEPQTLRVNILPVIVPMSAKADAPAAPAFGFSTSESSAVNPGGHGATNDDEARSGALSYMVVRPLALSIIWGLVC